MCVDDLVHSSTFSEHLQHTGAVLHKFTTAGFTVNAAKCQNCKPEIKFLGHIISDKTVRPDKERIEAILRYPAPKNQTVANVPGNVQLLPAVYRSSKLFILCRAITCAIL